ncbi:hypothetical protein [Mycobacterium sp. ACS4331]|uniref:hypothetical protein n=1 Tax=Mycobacterium sp. ACS4331 TaxID=1834121 RepID=UPI0007FDD52F|nr:hypothetical protein [Mycobacterium sp. ACS4331]OBF17516.1 hypothetical protein A5727_12025 [Mycobacterium sp. ACS4331]
MAEWALGSEPMIFMPTEAATVVAPDGKKMAFFMIPQIDLLIKSVLAVSPEGFTYQWGFHAGERVHVLFVRWTEQLAVGMAIPEGVGDAVLSHLLGTTEIFLTTHPVQEALSGQASAKAVEAIIYGNTVRLPEIKFSPEA